MKSPVITPDSSDQARELIEIGLCIDSDSRSETLARLIAASLHHGIGTALERFASTGRIAPECALRELGNLRVRPDQERWVSALGDFIIAAGSNNE